ncbi:MAG: 4-hydroxythreonine-4-phosphate dehydrogenase PdxA [Candidatus Latescibacteria bacterium]|nr:4-hydroxythreonine-4-phosphate dehydrogenase PdxA [Candidatus Latescibacterota bacterium]
MGDPAGIGPEILARTLANATLRREARLVAVGDPEILGRAARLARAPVRLKPVAPDSPEIREDDPRETPIVVSGTGTWAAIEPGVPSEASGRAAARSIEVAAAIASRRGADALVTPPISKMALKSAGYPFPGHTEFLGSLTGARETRMLFTGGRFRILLATIHLALRRVSDSLETGSLLRTLEYGAAALRNFGWGMKKRIAVLALNPHAGEGGLFGDEETRVIGPAIERAKERGIRAEGPFPADTFFAHRAIGGDIGVVVAMYHDQGLIPAKMGGIGGAANVTLGLPFIRASVDHGTAFDRAWKRGARPDPAGLIKAALVAVDLASRSRGRILEWAWP